MTRALGFPQTSATVDGETFEYVMLDVWRLDGPAYP